MTKRRWAAGFIAVALLAGTQVGAAGASTSAPSAAADAAKAERLLRAASAGQLTVRRDSAGDTHYVGTPAGKPVQRPSALPRGATATTAARAHLTAYGALFGLNDQARQLRVEDATALGKGESAVRFRSSAGASLSSAASWSSRSTPTARWSPSTVRPRASPRPLPAP